MQIYQHLINSGHSQREVALDVYFTGSQPRVLLLVNDGQDLPPLTENLSPAVCVVAIHAGANRRQEYGVAGIPNYQQDGSQANLYAGFITMELLPFLEIQYPALAQCKRAFAGFSLGGLSALDIVWQHPQLFQLAGVFSGALWWRDKPLGPGYSDEQHRIIHRLVRESTFRPGMQFFFECGTADETADRNNNGIIDSIDDTRDLIQELVQKGYHIPRDITYLEIPGGKHDMATWKVAMEAFLELEFFRFKE